MAGISWPGASEQNVNEFTPPLTCSSADTRRPPQCLVPNLIYTRDTPASLQSNKQDKKMFFPLFDFSHFHQWSSFQLLQTLSCGGKTATGTGNSCLFNRLRLFSPLPIIGRSFNNKRITCNHFNKRSKKSKIQKLIILKILVCIFDYWWNWSFSSICRTFFRTFWFSR